MNISISTYEVKKEDTLESVSEQLGISVEKEKAKKTKKALRKASRNRRELWDWFESKRIIKKIKCGQS